MKRFARLGTALLVLVCAVQAGAQSAQAAEPGWCEIGCGGGFLVCIGSAVFEGFPPAEYCLAFLEGCVHGCDYQ
jgi:hypothetical protein